MSIESDREVQLAVEQIKALFAQTEDPVERFKRLSALLDGWPDLHKTVRIMRQDVGGELYAGGEGMNYKAIGELIGVTESRARHIVRGITNPSRQKRQEEQRAKGEREGSGTGGGGT
ncbi:hypothetical protein [Streptomyces sp. NPDC001750]|uniref:hypothetical protein n=1 Tax=Streptomyces sp. NPDC001750 TaxID=3364607 RepID=UPI0036778870